MHNVWYCVLICIISVFYAIFVDFVMNNLPRFLGNISRWWYADPPSLI